MPPAPYRNGQNATPAIIASRGQAEEDGSEQNAGEAKSTQAKGTWLDIYSF